jgi:esterase FrsA
MNDIDELKQFATLHARAQNIANYRALLDRIDNDEDGTPGSWAVEWSQVADEHLAAGRLLDASRHYAMARFPYPDGPARQQAADSCVRAFDRWRGNGTGVQRLDADTPDGPVHCWATGLSRTEPRPLLLVMGGIVSVKEQWAPVLPAVRRLGMAGIAAEMPGVGENGFGYGPESWRMLPALLDAVADRADVAQTYAIALSFSGHLALRCAAQDGRVRGIVTAGAPVSRFFTDPEWQAELPRITVDTLAHLTGTKPADLADRLRPLALTAEQLAAVRVPVGYLLSRRDEIIPADEAALLRNRLPDLRLVENYDVHGSPRHVTESRLWTVLSVLQMRRVHSPQRAVLSALWHTLRVGRRLTGAPR